MEVYNTVNELNIICLSGCFLESSTQTENNNLEINGYKMVRADHPNILKKGSVCAYVKEFLSVCSFSTSCLRECFTLEVTISNKKGYVITLYRSPSETPDEFDTFVSNLENS